MRHRKLLLWIGLWMGLPLLIAAAGCGASLPPTRRVNSALDFLYPEGVSAAEPASQVVLKLPVRVGLAFAPNRGDQFDPIPEEQKQWLLSRVAAAFKEHEAIEHLEVVPTTYLQPGGSFANLDQIRSSLGLDLMVLLSYDQSQFTESTRASWTYWTVIGPLLIEGEKNDTRTVMDAVVYDVRSRALLFRSLNSALEQFEEQAKRGTVQGPGTPEIAMYNAKGEQITATRGGGGALGIPELIVAALLGLALLVRRPE
jgi:hypothetical protein